ERLRERTRKEHPPAGEKPTARSKYATSPSSNVPHGILLPATGVFHVTGKGGALEFAAIKKKVPTSKRIRVDTTTRRISNARFLNGRLCDSCTTVMCHPVPY